MFSVVHGIYHIKWLAEFCSAFEVGLNYRECAMPTAAISPVWRIPMLLYQLDASGHVDARRIEKKY